MASKIVWLPGWRVWSWDFRHQDKTLLNSSLLAALLSSWRDKADLKFYERTIEGFKTGYALKGTHTR